MSYSEHRTKDRRLAILRTLAEEPDYSINESLCQDILKQLGHAESRETIRADFTWFEEQGMVELSHYADVMVAKINRRGLDISQGHSSHPGVKRPGP